MRDPRQRGRGPHIPPLDKVMQYEFAPGYVVFAEPTAKRIRAVVNDVVIADSTRTLILQESDHLPVYYLPLADIRMDLMTPTNHRTKCPFKGTAHYHSLDADGKRVENILWTYPEPLPACPDISAHGSLYWDKVDHWYEEDEEVFAHARDPHHRIDCLPSTRRVEIVVDGRVVADSRNCVFLFETGLPTRYYVPREDLRGAELSDSDLTTRCPYKGQARYHHLSVDGKRFENLVWFYPEPLPEAARIEGRLCFYNERVDRILVDGEEVPRPEAGPAAA